MERRKKSKRNKAEYKRLDREIRRKCNKAKERWINDKCDEFEMLPNIDKNTIYSKIKELTGGQ